MTRRPPTTETRIIARILLSAGVLAVLVLACVDTATGVNYTTIGAASAT
jgi:hypothetical protein